MTLQFHPYANLFPLIEGDAFKDFCADIKANGIRQKIRVLDGKILDGRNRYRAGIAAGIIHKDQTRSIHFEKFDPEIHGDPLDYVISENFHRRHMDVHQRAIVAAKYADMRQGERTDLAAKKKAANLPKDKKPKVSQAAAARMMSVSERSLRNAKVVLREGSPGLVRAAEQGVIAVDAAARAAKLAPEVQKEIVREAQAGRANAVRTAVKRAAREDKEKALAVKQIALPDKRYGVILADPEWRFEPRSRDTGMDRAADNHYPTSATEEIMARPVGKIAAKDCVLFLWATEPMLGDALRVAQAWGFAHKSGFVWHKDFAGRQQGTGYWNRNAHEHLLICTRGNPPAPAPGTQWVSVLKAPVGKHSEKPEIFHGLIEAYFPNLPKIELNARRSRKGWDLWGNEAPTEEALAPKATEVRKPK